MPSEGTNAGDQTDRPGTPPATPASSAPRNGAQQQNARSRNNNKQRGRGNKTPSDPRFNDRVKRLASDIAGKQMARVSKAIGLERFDPKAFEQKLAQLEKERDEGLSVSDRVEKKMNDLLADNTRLRDENGKLKGDLAKFRKERERALEEVEELKIEHELHLAAREAGIVDPEYAIDLFRRHVREDPEQRGNTKPDEFFNALKENKKLRYLFQEEPVPAGSRAPEMRQDRLPPQPPPPPAPPGKGEIKETNVLEMDKDGRRTMGRRDFDKYTEEKYGFRAGA